MATQLKHTDLAFTTALTPRPKIRVAFTAGDAIKAAVSEPAAALTLEELAIVDHAKEVIGLAKLLLSPVFYARFLEWGAAAARFSSNYDDDDKRSTLCGDSAAAVSAIANTDAVNLHDIALKSWLLILEAPDAPGFGPLHYNLRRGGTLCEDLASGLHGDVSRASPLPAAIELLSASVQRSSTDASAWKPEVGEGIAVAFENASTADATGPTHVSNNWNGALADYLTARAASDRCPVDDDAEGDRLVDAYCVAMDHLINNVASPDAAALMLKMQLMKERQDGFDLIDEYMEALRRDVALLAARDGVAPRSGAADPHAALLAERDRLLALVNDSPTTGNNEERSNELIATVCTIDDLIISMSAASQQGVLAKLLLLAQTVVEGHQPPMDWWVSVISCAQSVTGMGSTAAAGNWEPVTATPTHSAAADQDAEITAAFTTYRGAFAEMEALPADSTDADQDKLYEIMDPATEMLLSVSAGSIGGAVAKLRHAFAALVDEPWAVDGVIDPGSDQFTSAIAMDGVPVRMMWSAIEDLARIGSLNLLEQGR